MVDFGELKKEFDALGVTIVAASIDVGKNAQVVADETGLTVAGGVTRDDAKALDSWWEDRRSIIQPSEFLLDTSGKVLTSSYSSGPIGRMDAADVIGMIKHREAQK